MGQTDRGQEKGDQYKERGRGETIENGGTESRRDSATVRKEEQKIFETKHKTPMEEREHETKQDGVKKNMKI